MADHLVAAGLVPARIVVSSSARTRETVRRMLDVLGDVEIVVDPDLYHASPADIKGVVEAHIQDTTPLMVVGHNPGMEMLASSVAQALTPFPTAAVAHIRIGPDGPPVMVDVWRPKELIEP